MGSMNQYVTKFGTSYNFAYVQRFTICTLSSLSIEMNKPNSAHSQQQSLHLCMYRAKGHVK